jgi:hypothetical protein
VFEQDRWTPKKYAMVERTHTTSRSQADPVQNVNFLPDNKSRGFHYSRISRRKNGYPSASITIERKAV